MKATLDSGQLAVSSVPMETDGSAPLISPDGRRVAFLQDLQPPAPGSKTLKIRHLETGDVTTVSQRSTLPVLGRLHWGSLPMQWTPDGRSLLFVEQLPPESGDRLKRTGYSLKQYVVDSKETVRLVEVSANPENTRSLSHCRQPLGRLPSLDGEVGEGERTVCGSTGRTPFGERRRFGGGRRRSRHRLPKRVYRRPNSSGIADPLAEAATGGREPADEVVEITREGARRSIRTMLNFGESVSLTSTFDDRCCTLFAGTASSRTCFLCRSRLGRCARSRTIRRPTSRSRGSRVCRMARCSLRATWPPEDIWLLRRIEIVNLARSGASRSCRPAVPCRAGSGVRLCAARSPAPLRPIERSTLGLFDPSTD